MSRRRSVGELLVLAAVATAVAGVPAHSADARRGSGQGALDTGRSGESGNRSGHEHWVYLPYAAQPGGAVVAVPERTVNLVTPVDGIDWDARRSTLRSRSVYLLVDDAGASDGQTVRVQLWSLRDGVVRWTRERCLPVREAVAVSRLRRGDQLAVQILTGADDLNLADVQACSGHPVGGTIDLWS